MIVSDMTTSTFWKGEAGVRGTVQDGESSYEVKLMIKGSQVYDYSCSCVEGNSYKGMCPHGRFLWEHFRQGQKQALGRPVSTSQEARTMIREYTNREVAALVRREEAQVRLVPVLVLDSKEIRLKFKIGRERFYMLKELTAFVQALETGSLVSYGKHLEFHHSLEAFVPEDRELVILVAELVNLYREHFQQFKKSSYVTVGELRELVLSRANRDRFFGIMKGRTLAVERWNTCFQAELVEGPGTLEVTVEKAGRDGIRVSIPQETYSFAGEEHFYVGSGRQIRRLGPEETAGMGIFLEQLSGTGSHRQVEVQERDIPLFYERVLRRILPYSHMVVKDVDLESYRPQELKAAFFFDSTGPGEITMEPLLSYGDFSFHPVHDDRVPRSVCRDVPGEFRVSQVITRYFSYQDAAGEKLVIREDDDALYRLLKDGIREFMDLGQVHISREAEKLRILPSPRLHVGVEMKGSWLELQVDAEGMGKAELAGILARYSPKKPYYRLKSGEFLALDESGLVTVARLVDALAISRSQLKSGTVRLPGYRALYLDHMLKDSKDISLYRDQLFKAVVRGMKSVEDSDYEIPKALGPVLRGYQKTGFCWLKTLEYYGFGGILADDMGLGKTLQIIAFLVDSRDRQGGVSLVVCPASLVYNWESELRRFAPELKVTVVAGNAASREEALEGWEKADVLVTSYDLLKRDIRLYEGKSFRCQVLDEAQYIKNPATQSARAVKCVTAGTRFALTGTPVENRLGELWSIFDYLMPGFLLEYQRFKREFEIPAIKEGDTRVLETLRRLTGPFILRRLKRDVLKELPEKLETVIWSRAEGEQRRVYQAYALELKQQLESMDGSRGPSENMQILAKLTRLRQLCCDPSLCLEGYRGGSAKLETCIQLVKTAVEGGHKLLLFSQFTSMLEILARRLGREDIAFHMLTGATPGEERLRMAQAFQGDKVPVFLISLKAGGTGLNLTAADMVIHYDPWWNAAAQNQATDRTHRIGQTKQVNVYRLIMKDTIEENILKLQEQKRSLADQIITEGTLSLASLSREELMELVLL